MRTKAVLGSMVGVVALASTAVAKPYASRGTFEVGGTIEFWRVAGEIDIDGYEDVEQTETHVAGQPWVYAFPLECFRLGIGLDIAHDVEEVNGDASSSTTVGVAGSITYFFTDGRIYYGPLLGIGYSHLGGQKPDSAFNGFQLNAGGTFRVPVGRALLGMTAAYNFASWVGETENTDVSMVIRGFSAGLDFGMYF